MPLKIDLKTCNLYKYLTYERSEWRNKIQKPIPTWLGELDFDHDDEMCPLAWAKPWWRIMYHCNSVQGNKFQIVGSY